MTIWQKKSLTGSLADTVTQKIATVPDTQNNASAKPAR